MTERETEPKEVQEKWRETHHCSRDGRKHGRWMLVRLEDLMSRSEKQARARELKEQERDREWVCFGAQDNGVGEGEGLLFIGINGEERVG